MAHGLIRKGHAAARGRRRLHLVCRLIMIVLPLASQFLPPILAKLLKEVRQILLNLARFHIGLLQGVQDLLSQRPWLLRLLSRGTEMRNVGCIRNRHSGRWRGGRRGTSGRLRDHRSRRRRPTRGSWVRCRNRVSVAAGQPAT